MGSLFKCKHNIPNLKLFVLFYGMLSKTLACSMTSYNKVQMLDL